MDYYTHRIVSDKLHRLLVTLSYFRLDCFVQFLSLIPILILLLYLLVSIDLVYINLCELVSRMRSLVQTALVLKLQVKSALRNKWVVSLMEYDWLVFNIL